MGQLVAADNPTKAARKVSEHLMERSNGASHVWPFVLSTTLVVYVSIFYIFDLSPKAALFNSTKFWFFISNTLIVLIAADSGALSPPSKPKECPLTYPADQENGAGPPEATTVNDETSSIIAADAYPRPQEPIIDNRLCHTVVISPGEKLMSGDETSNGHGTGPFVPSGYNNHHMVKEWDADVKAVEDEDVEDDEFSAMSDEELNRRVEEFIQNFNRQIRLQANAQPGD